MAFAAGLSTAGATLNGTINPKGIEVASTATEGNFISLTDLQTIITTRADLHTAGVLSGENADDTQTTLAAELANGGATFSLSGFARWSRNDTPPGPLASGSRFGFVNGTETWNFGTAVPQVGAAYVGVILKNGGAAGGAITLTAHFSDGTTDVFNATAPFTVAQFVGFKAPDGTTITSIGVVEPAGGAFLQFDDLAVVLNPPAPGDVTWAGTGADAKWSTAANWNPAAVPAENSPISFNNSLNTSAVNDLAAGRAYAGLNFLPGAGPFVITGNELNPGSFIANSSVAPQTLNLPLNLTQDVTLTISGAPLNLNGSVSGDFGFIKTGAQPLTLSGTSTFNGVLNIDQGPATISGDLSGAAGGIRMANTNSPVLTIEATGKAAIGALGELYLGNSAGTGTGAVTCNIAGSLASDGAVKVLRGSAMNVTGTVTISETGSLAITGIGGYGATLLIGAGGSLDYAGTSPIALKTGTNDFGRARLTVDSGLLSTAQPVTANAGGDFPGLLTLRNGGTLKLTGDFFDLASDAQLFLETGDGFLDTNGHDATVSAPLTGTGNILKIGLGSLTLAATTSTWEGGLSVRAGTLVLQAPTPGEKTAVTVGPDAVLKLDFADTDTIGSLTFDGVPASSGTWGGVGSGADHISPLLSGTGKLLIPSTDATLTLLPAPNGQVTVTWSGGTLETSENLIDWAPQTAAVSPLTEPASGRKFFRVRP
jgi:autotransporter-associated beta strand protein